MKLTKYLRKILLYINCAFALLLSMAYISVYIDPSKLAFPALFGLAYPYLLIVNLGFLFFWAIRKNRYIFISLVVILIGWKHIGSNIKISFGNEEKETGQKISVLSYNIHMEELAYHYNKNSEKKEILDFIINENPDFICFQDYYVRYGRPIIIPHRIDERYPLKNSYIIRGSVATNYGLAILSKYPLIAKGEIHFENTSNFCLYADFRIGTEIVRIYNVHLQSIQFATYDYEIIDSLARLDNQNRLKQAKGISSKLMRAFEKRAGQVKVLTSHIKRSPYKTIVCGDFNDTPVSYTYKCLTDFLEDAYRQKGSGFGNTFIGKAPSFRIDYIFHDESMKTLKYTKPKIKASDHFPVNAVISLND